MRLRGFFRSFVPSGTSLKLATGMGLMLGVISCGRGLGTDLEGESRVQFIRWSIRAAAAARSCENIRQKSESAADLLDSLEQSGRTTLTGEATIATGVHLEAEWCEESSQYRAIARAWMEICGMDCIEKEWWEAAGLHDLPLALKVR